MGLDWYFIRVKKSPQVEQGWTATSLSKFISYWYTYLQTRKFLILFSTPLTENDYTASVSFHFGELICKQDPNLHMASLDVDFLFTNILQYKTINIFIDSFYNHDENVPKIPRMFFIICWTWPQKNVFLCLPTNSIKRLIMWVWNLHWVQL